MTVEPQLAIASSSANIPNSPIHIDSALLGEKPAKTPPIRVIIPSLQIDVPTAQSKVVNGYWELSETTASHGLGSAFPGENSNMVIFAHAREGLFLPLRRIEKDELVYILTTNEWYRYRVTQVTEVSPNDITVVGPTKTETLTLFTCTGFLDNKRLIVTAVPYRP